MRLHMAFLWVMIASLAAAAMMGIFAILFEGLGDTAVRSLLTSLLVGAFSLTALGCAFVLDRGRLKIAMWAGVVASIGALATWTTFVWFDAWGWRDPWDDLSWKLGTTLIIVAVWAMHLGLIALPPIRRRAWRIVRKATIAVAAALALTINLTAWLEADSDAVWKLIAVGSIMTACGTIVTPILALIEKIRHRGEPGAVERRIEVQVTCPRCGIAQPVATGGSRCASCSLKIAIEVAEPRCPCGYLLFGLRGETCPECGRAIDERDRWVGGAGSDAVHMPRSATG